MSATAPPTRRSEPRAGGGFPNLAGTVDASRESQRYVETTRDESTNMNDPITTALPRSVRRLVTTVAALTLFLPGGEAPAQLPGGEVEVKGVFEPANIPVDVTVTDLYFVTPDVGWASTGAAGEGGALFHTRDGGATWSRVLGDPSSSEPAYQDLHFIDENHGWTLQGSGVYKLSLLRTRDGRTWEPHGTIEYAWGLGGYQFLSPSSGVVLDGNNNISRILKTTDGGRTWREVFHGRGCVTVPVQGLTRTLDCPLEAMRFASPRVGYAVGQHDGLLFVARTEDAGESWSAWAVPDLVAAPGSNFDVPSVHFLDEDVGMVGLSDGRWYRTTDGGRSWTGVIGARGSAVAFADPEVGWARGGYHELDYTTDGGRTWNRRALGFPAKITAVSLPHRDRGYVAGEHGMVYRYRVAPASEAVPGALAGPLMPAFDTPLDEGVERLRGQLDELRAALASAGGGVPSGGAPGVPPAVPSSAEGAESPAAGDVASGGAPFDPACCAEMLDGFDLALGSVATEVPIFLETRRPLHLLVAGLRWAALLPARIRDIEGAVAEFQAATDLPTAELAVDRMEGSVDQLVRATRQAFGREIHAPGEWAEVDRAFMTSYDAGASPATAVHAPAVAGDPAADADDSGGGLLDRAAGKLKVKIGGRP